MKIGQFEIYIFLCLRINRVNVSPTTCSLIERIYVFLTHVYLLKRIVVHARMALSLFDRICALFVKSLLVSKYFITTRMS